MSPTDAPAKPQVSARLTRRAAIYWRWVAFIGWLDAAPRPAVTRPAVATPATGDFWYRLAWCESRMRQDATSSTGKYLSYFQWSRTTWAAAKDAGDPSDPRQVSYQRQVVIAQRWAARTNPWTQWPVCWGRALNG
jgi:hypothetical protein